MRHQRAPRPARPRPNLIRRSITSPPQNRPAVGRPLSAGGGRADDGLDAGDAVTAEQMRGLFGAGMRPLTAERLESTGGFDRCFRLDLDSLHRVNDPATSPPELRIHWIGRDELLFSTEVAAARPGFGTKQRCATACPARRQRAIWLVPPSPGRNKTSRNGCSTGFETARYTQYRHCLGDLADSCPRGRIGPTATRRSPRSRSRCRCRSLRRAAAPRHWPPLGSARRSDHSRPKRGPPWGSTDHAPPD